MGVLEFPSMVTPTTTKFIFRAPPLSFVTNIYYLPFDVNVWFSLVALVIISCFVIFITYRVASVRDPSIEHLRPSDIALFGISSICQMGIHREPKYLSGKISTVLLYDVNDPHKSNYFFRFFSLLPLYLCILHTQLTLCHCFNLQLKVLSLWNNFTNLTLVLALRIPHIIDIFFKQLVLERFNEQSTNEK